MPSKDELLFLLGLPPESIETYMVMAEANRLSKELSGGKAEVHAQFALNLVPCSCDCLFCSFARVNDVFHEATELPVKQAVAYVRQFEADGTNAIFIMSTAGYPFEWFIEISEEARRNLNPETTLVANVGDQTLTHAKRLKDAGFAGVYRALRLREGTDSTAFVDHDDDRYYHLSVSQPTQSIFS